MIQCSSLGGLLPSTTQQDAPAQGSTGMNSLLRASPLLSFSHLCLSHCLMCARVSVCVCMHACVCTCMCMHAYICVQASMNVCICVCVCAHVCMSACMHACAYVSVLLVLCTPTFTELSIEVNGIMHFKNRHPPPPHHHHLPVCGLQRWAQELTSRGVPAEPSPTVQATQPPPTAPAAPRATTVALPVSLSQQGHVQRVS